MRNKDFFNIDQARSYLSGSIIRLGEVPIYIRDVSIGKRETQYIIHYMKLEDGSTGYLDSKDPDFNMVPVPLGMFYVDKDSDFVHTRYVVRAPRRMWKVGLCYENIVCFAVTPHDNTHFRVREWMTSKQMCNTVLGEYLNVEDAIAQSNNGKKTIPFSRDFATDGTYIYYKSTGISIGCWNGKDAELIEEASHLKEALDEAMNGTD